MTSTGRRAHASSVPAVIPMRLPVDLSPAIGALVNVLFGAIFLHERLTRWQLASVSLATIGVLNLTLGYGRFPWIALVLCVSFGLYGLLRKKSGTAPTPGLFFEATLLAPFAVFYLVLLHHSHSLVFGTSGWQVVILVVSSGLITGLPLVWFGRAARHLRLTTVGFLQYLAPSCSFFLGVFLYHEPFTRAHFITFGLIWTALGIFTAEALLRWKSSRRDERAAGRAVESQQPAS